MEQSRKKIARALISVYHKDGLEAIISNLHECGVEILSTGGTQAWIQAQGIPVKAVEDLTGYPSILGGRVKTLHPKVFGGILGRRSNDSDCKEMEEYDVPGIDLVIVDLYPFRETVEAGGSEQEIIEKIDIGGPTMLRAAAKNFNDVTVIVDPADYEQVLSDIRETGNTTLKTRFRLAVKVFQLTSTYDTTIARWLEKVDVDSNAYFQGE